MDGNLNWKKPNFKGLTLLGPWRECEAIVTAQKRGSIALEESDFCGELGIQSQELEAWLCEHWLEHDVQAVMDGTEKCATETLSLIRRYDGVLWDGLSPRPNGGRPMHFQLRLLSPGPGVDSALLNRLRQHSGATIWEVTEIGKPLVRPVRPEKV